MDLLDDLAPYGNGSRPAAEHLRALRAYLRGHLHRERR